MAGKNKIFDELARIAPLIPTPFYWLDTSITIIGANEPSLESVGKLGKVDQIIGKSFPDFLPEEFAKELVATTKLVIKTAKRITVEEHLFNANGEEKYFETVKSPLFDDENNLIGVLCTAIEITDRKEKEKIKLEQQEQFRKISAQVAHDLGSPLAALQMVIPHCDKLPEHTRNVLNKSAIRIADIAENFLSQFRPQEEQSQTKVVKEPTLISAETLEVLTEKKYQYSKHMIEFVSNISQAGAFAFIEIDNRSFKRMLSNVINNAVEAINEGKPGEVIVSLDSANYQVQITIADSGTGMPEEIKDKLLNNIKVTAGKAEGYGIGYTQIRDTITQNNGSLFIETEKDKGTRIIINFPQTTTPEWMTEKLDLQADDLVVILDDDESIHDAWETRFESAGSRIKRQHFKRGLDAIRFINNQGTEAKQKVFLLTDYELLRQDLNGLDVIAQTGINRSVLVTSHHNNLDIRHKAQQTNTKILPKSLASLVPINFLASVNKLIPVADKIRPRKKEFVLNEVGFTEETLKLIKYFESFSETVPAATYLFDTELRVIGVNSRVLNLLSTTKDKLFGKTVYEIYPTEVADDLTEGFKQVLQSGRELITEHKVPDFNTGNYLYFEATLSPLYNDHGKIVGIIGASIEITAKKEVQQLFMESQSDFRKLCAQVAHDLGSPATFLQQIIPQCDENLPSGTKTVLNESAMRIADIAEKLHAWFNPYDEQNQNEIMPATKIIEINHDDRIIILSDDEAICGIWETRFKEKASTIKRWYFKHASEAKELFSQFSHEDLQKTFLLADYEMLQQDLKFLDVIEQSVIKKSILITRHHNNPIIKYKARLNNTHIFPKPLITGIEINLLNKDKEPHSINANDQQVDLVILDDDVGLVDTLITYMLPPDKKVDKYHKPYDVFNSLNNYPKQTKFLIDNQYDGETLSGIEVVLRLKEYGYTNLYLFTNEILEKHQIPDYVQIIAKDNLQAITSLLNHEN